MPKVSIIIPVYNAEKYLKETLDSVLNQTYLDFEVIALNDGSKDGSLSILNEYAKKDERFVVIDKPNSGVSDTRNLGIEKASGEYIACLDADDLYSPNFLFTMVSAIEENNANVVVCEYETFRTVATKIYQEQRYEKLQKVSLQELLDSGLMTSMCVKLFNRELLKNYNIKIDKNLSFGEDLFFCWKACLVGKDIYKVNQKLYAYRLSGEGATSKYHEGVYEKYKYSFANLKDFCAQNKLETKNNFTQIDLYFTKRLPALSMMCARQKASLKTKKKNVAKILNDESIKAILNDSFSELIKGAPKQICNLYKNAKNGNAGAVLWFGQKLNFRIKLSNLKNKLRGK